MDIVKEQADLFVETKFRYRSIEFRNYKSIVDDARMAASDIDNELDRTKFLEYILRVNTSDYDKHLVDCKRGDECTKNKAYEAIGYYLQQEINRIGIASVGDVFTEEEKETADSKLDKILSEIEKIKDENTVMYKHFKKSFEELKGLHVLGKGKWYQLLLGKSTEMVVGGIVSETISKPILAIATGAAIEMIKLL